MMLPTTKLTIPGAIEALITAIIMALTPIHGIIVAIGVLIMADLITGLVAAIHAKEKIESKKLRNTILKMCIYQIAIISAFLLETFIFKSGDVITRVVAGTIGLTEFKSIIENLEKTTEVRLIDKLKSVVKNWEAK